MAEPKGVPQVPGVRVEKRRTPTGLDVWTVGAEPETLRDVYHAFLRMSWAASVAAIALAFLLANVPFALAFLATGGIQNARPGSFFDAFVFSVQTFGTIGYGAMYPNAGPAHLVVIAEAVVGLLFSALATGLVFAKFSRMTPQVRFTRRAVVAPMNGVPTLMVRLGNQRSNTLLEAQVRMTYSRRTTTAEGVAFYLTSDLKLARDRMAGLTRGWTVMHPITPDSPLFGLTPEDLAANQAQIGLSLFATDDTALQAVHASAAWGPEVTVFGSRHADVLSEGPEGSLIVDMRQFDELVPGQPTADFPYPRPAPAASA